MTVLVITGTGTGVGKTIATAALACHARSLGGDVAVCKPVQTGTGTADTPGDDDLAEVKRLSGVEELLAVARYREPLAPAAAADLEGRALPSAAELLGAVRSIDRPGRLTLVEGAGGLVVELTAQGETLRDLAAQLDAPVLVVCAAGLGTLNHTALTLEALEAKGVSCAGLVVGSWPESPGLAERSNLSVLERMAAVRAVLPQDASRLGGDAFAAMSRRVFDSHWVAALR